MDMQNKLLSQICHGVLFYIAIGMEPTVPISRPRVQDCSCTKSYRTKEYVLALVCGYQDLNPKKLSRKHQLLTNERIT